MLRSMLIGLDGSPHSERALDLGIAWARRFDSKLVGVAVVDDPGIRGSEGMLLAEGYHGSIYKPLLMEARQHVERTLQQFVKRCKDSEVGFRAIEGEGTPYVEILQEAQAHDLVLLGQATHFEYGWGDQDDETLSRVVKDSPRPVVVVPREEPVLKPQAVTLIGCDGSLPSSQAIASFVASGLDMLGPVMLLGIGEYAIDAERNLHRAVEYFRAHDIEARPHPIVTKAPPAQVLLERAKDWNAGLLVLGAYGQPTLREFFLGSVTRTILRETTVPLFLNH